MNTETKLIVLRGPSGAGKSSTANELISTTKRPAALIEQDYFRGILFPKDETHKRRAALIAAITTRALQEGYDVILEGLLTMRSYDSCFNEITSMHPSNNYFFYFDIGFDATVERTKNKGDVKWTIDDMKEWYPSCTPTGYHGEIIIPEHFSLSATVKHIKNITGL